MAGAEAQLARGLLLQGRGGEGGEGVAAHRLALDGGNVERRPGRDLGSGRLGRRLIGQVELLQLAAVEMGQARREDGPVLGREDHGDGPIFLRLEGLDLGLALADEAQRHRLDPARRAAAGQLAPEDRREGEADQVIQGAPGEIGLHQLAVDLAGTGHGVEHGGFGDLVEHDPRHRLAGQGMAALQLLADMPGDGLALAVRVGGEDQAVGGFQRLGNGLDPDIGLAVDLPAHGEVFLGPDRAVLGGQVAHMAEARQHGVIRAEIFIDGLRLGGRFDDDDVHRATASFLGFWS